MSTTLVLRLSVFLCALFSATAEATLLPFKDDFEDLTLDAWTIGGRQQQGAAVSHVAVHQNSHMGYLFKTNFTEITMERAFPYHPDLSFAFDLEAHASSPFSSSSADYAHGAANMSFWDKSGGGLGGVAYARTTSTWPVGQYNNDHRAYNPITDDGMHSYSFTLSELLAQTPGIDVGDIATVKLSFSAYSSGTYDALQSAVYIDNVVVTPEPAAGVLLLLGAVFGVFRRRIP